MLYLFQHLYQLGEPRRLLQKLEQQEQELERRRTLDVQQGFEEIKSKMISNELEPIQSDPTSCPQNRKGNNKIHKVKR